MLLCCCLCMVVAWFVYGCALILSDFVLFVVYGGCIVVVLCVHGCCLHLYGFVCMLVALLMYGCALILFDFLCLFE